MVNITMVEPRKSMTTPHEEWVTAEVRRSWRQYVWMSCCVYAVIGCLSLLIGILAGRNMGLLIGGVIAGEFATLGLMLRLYDVWEFKKRHARKSGE